jgi:branched-chain amino acid transport system permease protein
MRVKLLGFCLSAWFAGALGAAMAVRWTYIDPHTVFNPFIVFQTVLISMVGGPLTIGGPLVGALVFSLMSEFLRLSLPYLYMILLGVLLIVSVLYLPNGLAGHDWRGLWRRIFKRKTPAESVTQQPAEQRHE